MNPAAILLYGALGGILLLALGALFAPIRWGVRLFVNACFGVFGLAIVGVFGTVAGLRISINLLTVAFPDWHLSSCCTYCFDGKAKASGGGIRTLSLW